MCVCVCVCAALVTQHAKRMRPIILSLVCLAIQNFSTLPHKWHDFRNKVIEHKTSVLVFFIQGLSETFLSLIRIQRYIVVNVLKSSRKLPVILVIF